MLRDDDVRDKNAPISAEEGRGNSYSTEFRGYDPRRGQWLSIDPLAYKFPWSSPYVAMGNNPVIMVDPDGDKPTAYEAAVMANHVYSYYPISNPSTNVLVGGWQPAQSFANKKISNMV